MKRMHRAVAAMALLGFTGSWAQTPLRYQPDNIVPSALPGDAAALPSQPGNLPPLPSGMPAIGQAAGAQRPPGFPMNTDPLTGSLRPANPSDFAPEATRAGRAVDEPSQFQRFVREATGRELPVWGSKLFTAPQTYAPVTNIAPPANYVLGPGDEIQLQVWGLAELNANLTVDRSGKVVVPRVGALSVAGLRVEQLEGALRSHVGKVFNNFELTATVSKLRSIQVYVVGQAQRPGTYTLSSLSTLINALFASGGPNANGSMRAIQLKRGNQVVGTLDLYDFIARGNKSQDVSLQPGDVIVIPPAGPRVAVTGAYDHAAIYELKGAQDSVAQLLAIGGGVPTLASPQKAVLERVNPKQRPAREVKTLSLDGSGLQQTLQDGDVLTLLPLSPGFGNAVTLQGSVAQPLRHAWFDGMKLLDLIPDREALMTADYYRDRNRLVQLLDQDQAAFETPAAKARADESSLAYGQSRSRQPGDAAAQQKQPYASLQQANQALSQQLNQVSALQTQQSSDVLVQKLRKRSQSVNWDYALIERLDRRNLTTQLIPVNLGKAVLERDPAYNLPLQPDDVVTVFSQTDLQVPLEKQVRFVQIEGEVAAPGMYQALPGETLPQLLRRIGGLTQQAYVFGTEFTRDTVRKQQQKNLDQLIARLESNLQSQSSAQLANLTGDAAIRASALMESQKQAQQQQIARLKALRSNGRVALEINPQDNSLAALPSMPLEDGDRIVVPAVPAFVAAFGSVNNENVFIHKPGRTAGEVLQLAGLSDDADEDQAFVLRADGTVVSQRNRGWFSGRFSSTELMPGDTVVVPQKVDRETRWTAIVRNAKDITQILANMGLGLAALRSL